MTLWAIARDKFGWKPFYRGSGIIGPASVIQVELIDGRQWDEVVSEGGVVSYVGRIAKRALALPDRVS